MCGYQIKISPSKMNKLNSSNYCNIEKKSQVFNYLRCNQVYYNNLQKKKN